MVNHIKYPYFHGTFPFTLHNLTGTFTIADQDVDDVSYGHYRVVAFSVTSTSATDAVNWSTTSSSLVTALATQTASFCFFGDGLVCEDLCQLLGYHVDIFMIFQGQ